MSKKLGISPETITKALNQLVKEKRLIVANSEKSGKTFIRKVTF